MMQSKLSSMYRICSAGISSNAISKPSRFASALAICRESGLRSKALTLAPSFAMRRASPPNPQPTTNTSLSRRLLFTKYSYIPQYACVPPSPAWFRKHDPRKWYGKNSPVFRRPLSMVVKFMCCRSVSFVFKLLSKGGVNCDVRRRSPNNPAKLPDGFLQ